MKKVMIFFALLIVANQLKADVFCAYAKNRFSNEIVTMRVAQTKEEAKEAIGLVFYEDKNFIVEIVRSQYAGRFGDCLLIEAKIGEQEYQAVGVGEGQEAAFGDALGRFGSNGMSFGIDCSVKIICSRSFNFQ